MTYFDHHATAPVCAAAREAVTGLMAGGTHGNPSSVHGAGRAARGAMEHARAQIAASIGAAPRELVFTSGGTEALHLAVRGVGGQGPLRAVFVDPGAHPALLAASERLARERGAALETIASTTGGAIRIESLIERIAQFGGEAIVALSWVQHETGAVNDVRALSDAIRPSGARVVVDAVQAFGKVPIDAGSSGVYAMALSAHKIGGLTGAGAAWIAAGVRVDAQMTGGAQERGIRAGTENLVGIVAFGAAAADVPSRLDAMAAIAARRDRIEQALGELPGVVINARERPRAATACHASVRDVAGEELVAALDLEGFCVSSGPACSSGRPGPSTSMRAMYPDEPWRAASALRITLGPENTDAEVRALIAALPRVIQRVRG